VTARSRSARTAILLAFLAIGALLPANASALPEWDAPDRVSADGVVQGNVRTMVASGEDGRTVAAWITTAADGSSAPYDLVFAIRGVDGAWSAPTVLDDAVTSTAFQGFDTLVEHDGRYHLVWVGAANVLQHATLAPGASAWSTPEDVTEVATLGRYPALGVDGAGNLQVAYLRNAAGVWRVAWRSRSAAGTWGAVELAADEPLYVPAPFLKLHVADDGDTTVAWNGDAADKHLRAVQRDAGTGTWEAAATITTLQWDGTDFVLAGNAAGDVAIVTEVEDAGTYRRLVARRPDGGVWDGGSTIPNSLREGNVDAVVASDGRVTVAWHQVSGGVGRIHVNYRDITGGAWLIGLLPITEPAQSYGPVLRLQMAIDAEDQITTAWVHGNGIHAIRGNALSGWAVDGWRSLVADAEVSAYSLTLDRDDQPQVLYQSGAAAASEVRWSRWPIGPATISSMTVPTEARVGDVVAANVMIAAPSPLADSAITWRFGDGSGVKNGASVTYTWAKPGTYLVSVVAAGPTGTMDSETRTIQVGLAHVAPSIGTAPRVTGAARAGRSLTCAAGTWNGTGPMDVTTRWQSARSAAGPFADISTPADAAYALGAADQGTFVRCVASASNAGGDASAASDAVLVASPPRRTRAPRVTGAPRVGRQVTCNVGAWAGTAPLRYTYAWQRQVGRAWRAVPGATAARLRVGAGDVGRRVRCVVVATNVAGRATATSAPSAVVSRR
jgi:hypothetical protein